MRKLTQFSLRTLIAICVVATCFLIPFSLRLSHEQYFQNLPIERGTIVYFTDEKTAIAKYLPFRSKRLSTRTYVQFFDRTGPVNSKMTRRIGDCPLLEALRIVDGGDCDLLCREICNLNRLRVFTATDCTFSEQGVAALKKMMQLDCLVFNGTNLTSQQIAEIRESLPQTYIVQTKK